MLSSQILCILASVLTNANCPVVFLPYNVVTVFITPQPQNTNVIFTPMIAVS